MKFKYVILKFGYRVPSNKPLARFQKEIIANSVLDRSVLDELISKLVLLPDDREEIVGPPSQTERNKILLDILMDRPYNTFGLFGHILENTDSQNEDVQNIVKRMNKFEPSLFHQKHIEFSDNEGALEGEMSVEPKHSGSDELDDAKDFVMVVSKDYMKAKLQKNFKNIVQEVDCTGSLCDSLIERNIISLEDQEEICSTGLSKSESCRRMLTKLLRRDSCSYKGFLEVLRESGVYSYLANKIDTTTISSTDLKLIQLGDEAMHQRFRTERRNVQDGRGFMSSSLDSGRKQKPNLQRRTTEPYLGVARHKLPVYQGNGNRFVCSSRFGSIEVILKKGNIVDEEANMLVNVVASDCEFTSGIISQQFLRKGGQHIEREFISARQSGPTAEGLYITYQTGDLNCNCICHIELPKGRHDRNVLSQSIRSCFKTCSQLGLASVAMPAVGTGKLLGYPLDVVADCLVAEAKESGKYDSYLKKIKFIIYEKDHVEAFRSRIQGTSASGVARDTDHREVRSPQPREEPTHKPIASVSVSNISIELYAKSKSEGEKLRKTLSKEIKDTFLYEEKYSNPKLKFLHKDTWKKLTTAAKKYHVWLIQDSDKLIYKGEKDSVSKTRTECLEILLSDDKVQKPEQKVTVRRGSREWWIQKSLEKTIAPIYWKHFTEDEGFIDKAKDVAKKLILNKPGQLVPVDQDIFQAIADLVKNTWDTSKVGQGKDAQGLGHKNITINKVERIENFDLFDTYQTRKRSFYRKLAEEKRFSPLENITHQGTKLAQMGKIATRNISRKLTPDLDLFSYANECYFFHGTASGAVDNIIKKGLDEKYGGDNAMFGPGIYGAESSTKADQYADDKNSRQQKNRKMILMRLLLGNIYVTSQPERFNAPPCSNCLKPKCPNSKHEPFDSVVADGKWLFREFIVYRSNQCYPEYLITYDRV